MTEKKKDVDVKADAGDTNIDEKPLPAFVKAAPELLPLWDWWVKNGKSTIVTLIVIAVGFFGFIGVRSYLGSRNAKASKGLDAQTPEEIAEAVNQSGSAKTGAGLKLRLAKNHYDTDHFQDALNVYESVIKEDECLFLQDELPLNTPIRFKVTPLNSFRQGGALYSLLRLLQYSYRGN